MHHRPADDEALGEVLVVVRSGHLADDCTAEIGYTVRPSARGRGVARRAARIVADHVLSPVADGGLGLRRLVAETAADAPDGSVGPALHWERLAGG